MSDGDSDMDDRVEEEKKKKTLRKKYKPMESGALDDFHSPTRSMSPQSMSPRNSPRSSGSPTCMMSPKKFPVYMKATVYLATTGVGISGERVLDAVSGQYPDSSIHVEVIPSLNLEDLSTMVEDIKTNGDPSQSIIASTFVKHEMNQRMAELCAKEHIPYIDMIGPLLTCMEQNLGVRALQRPGLYMPKDGEYFHTVKAVEFALSHDEGTNSCDWPHADCILIGGPMVGKSALSVFLGTMGWTAANCTGDPAAGLPEALNDEVNLQRVFGLISRPKVNPDLKRKKKRQAEAVESGEMEALQTMLKERGITVLDVTGMPIESMANLVISYLDERFGDLGLGADDQFRMGPSW
uniref:Uncharacterized protein n=1 Tax=Eutreptiella gymnastica TaxID=73025 RepID=A0A7S1NKN4_9EUGL